MQPLELERPFHPLDLLAERRPPSTSSFCTAFRPAFQWSRRYSLVVSQVSLVALNVLFLISKFDSRMPSWTGDGTLLALSTLGVLSLHYTLDWMYKSAQDLRFALDHRSALIAFMATCRIAMQVNTAALTWFNFSAAVLGAAGQREQRGAIYQHMIAWGELALLAQIAMLFADIALVAHTKKELESNPSLPPSFAPRLRFYMDKDTLWKLEETPLDFDCKREIVLRNLSTQLKMTYGLRLGLILFGDFLQALEKWKTPDSKTAAVVNLLASSLWGGMICVEKLQEIAQRRTIEQNRQRENDEI